MTNTLNIKKADNQLILIAYQWSKSYEICNVKYAGDMDLKIDIKEGEYTGPVKVKGTVPSNPQTVNLPKGDYTLVYVGLNWGGPYNFEFEFNKKKYELLNDPNKPLVGAIWSLGNDSISFNVIKETSTVV